MSILGDVSDRQHVRREPEELHNDSRNMAIPLAILRTEGIENSGSEEPLIAISTFTLLFSKSKEKSLDDK